MSDPKTQTTTVRSAIKEILSPYYDVDGLLTKFADNLEYVVLLTLIVIDENHLDTQTARDFLAWDKRRSAA